MLPSRCCITLTRWQGLEGCRYRQLRVHDTPARIWAVSTRYNKKSGRGPYQKICTALVRPHPEAPKTVDLNPNKKCSNLLEKHYKKWKSNLPSFVCPEWAEHRILDSAGQAIVLVGGIPYTFWPLRSRHRRLCQLLNILWSHQVVIFEDHIQRNFARTRWFQKERVFLTFVSCFEMCLIQWRQSCLRDRFAL